MPKKKENLSPEERLIKAVIPKEEEPYTLPDNWVWTRLGDITTVLSGGTPSTSKEEYYKDGNISWITPKDLSNYKEKYIYKGARNITEEGLRKSSAVLLPKDSVLMSSRAPIGYVVICKKEVSTNQGFKNFAPSISYIPEYLYHYLKKSKNYLESIATGTTFKELSGEKAKKIIFPLSPLEEQKRIVEKLDSLFEKTEKIKEIIEEIKEKTSSRREAVLSKAFTGELTEKWRAENKTENAKELLLKINEEKLKNNPKAKIKDVSEMLVNEDEIPYKIPENWVWTKLENLVSILGDGIHGTPIYDDNGEYYFINGNNLNNGKIIIKENTKKVNETEYLKYKKNLTDRTIFVSINGTLGNLAFYNNEKIILGKSACYFNLSHQINKKFIYYLLKTDYFIKYAIKSSTGSTIKNLSLKAMKNVGIVLPSLEEQKEIVRILDKVFEEENKISELISLEEKIEILEKTILDKAFRGELGTGNSNDEPALGLLKRVLEENK